MRHLIDLVEGLISAEMEGTFKILNDLVSSGAINSYAVCGAMAAFEYIEAQNTRDVDVTIDISSATIFSFTPITSHLEKIGHGVEWEAEGLMIAGRPVQFIVAGDPLDVEALEHPVTVMSGATRVPIWRIEYLMAKCAQVRRSKDINRLLSFLEVDYDAKKLCDILARHGLTDVFNRILKQNNLGEICGSPKID